MKKLYLILILTVFVASCKKDRLKDDKAIFIGTWNWEYTEHTYGWCDGFYWEETLTPITEGMTFQLEFLETGKLNILKNGEKIISHKLKFKIFNEESPLCPGTDRFQFGILLNNEEELNFGGCINQNTIVTSGFKGFAFDSEIGGCDEFLNYFTRE
jgi:hypothetical protein